MLHCLWIAIPKGLNRDEARQNCADAGVAAGNDLLLLRCDSAALQAHRDPGYSANGFRSGIGRLHRALRQQKLKPHRRRRSRDAPLVRDAPYTGVPRHHPHRQGKSRLPERCPRRTQAGLPPGPSRSPLRRLSLWPRRDELCAARIHLPPQSPPGIISYTYLVSTTYVYSPGAGFDLNLSDHLAIKVDGQIQKWSSVPTASGKLYSTLGTIGLVYRFGRLGMP